ncbi:unnamed protein product, partial [Meganyctiphanes norvegica]
VGEERLKICAGCRLVSYCSKNCQKRDWSAHKGFCKVAKAQSEPGKNIYSSANEKIENGKSWFDIVLETSMLIKLKMGSKFGHIEGKILDQPKVCEFCRSSESSSLNLCKECLAVYYCSEDHLKTDAAVHKRLCTTFKLKVHCDEFLATKGYPDLLYMPFPSKPVTKYEKLPKGIADLINIPSDPIEAIISDWLSYPLTILYVLEQIGLGIESKPVHKAKKLTIHMMDSAKSLLRLHMSVTWEYLFHRLPNLKKLNVVMIDPELIAEMGNTVSNHFQRTHTLCGDCQPNGRKLTINVEGDFRTYKISDRYDRPDIILAHGVRDHITGQCLLPFPEPSIPLVLVGVIKDFMEMHLKFLKEYEEDTLKIPIQLNPFHGQRPMSVSKYMSQCEKASTSNYVDSRTCFVYGNGYICAVQRQTKKGGIRVRQTPNK